jgi:murein DD-endopeptidase MepM/ murein hydrolase activator NlpD
VIIAHGGSVRTFTIRPWLASAIAVGAAVFGLLYLTATGYLFFRDDILSAAFASQTHMKRAYEDRIALLRSDIDRLTSRQLRNQRQIEDDVARITDRQAALDARQDTIAALSQAARRVGVTPVVPQPATESKPLADAALRSSPSTGQGDPTKRLDEVQGSLSILANKQVAYVDSLAQRVTRRSRKIAAVLEQLGQKVPRSQADESDVGGPLVALSPDSDPSTFRASVSVVTSEVERFGMLRRVALRLPLSRPIPAAPISSPFGVRADPFLGTPAMHTGVDFEVPAGNLARATADGTVTMAGYDGGYGNMVEVDHGNGITTRYGHLSQIDVKVGEVVSKGTVLGHTGSTGRSTGPHLHYEIRVDGDPIDPMRYINAGSQIASLL